MDKQAVYLQTIKEAYPKLDISSVFLHTSEGQFNDIVFINKDLIFRFPRYEESLAGFLREIEVLQKLKGHVSLPIPDPIFIRSQTRSVGKVFMGYKILRGKPLFRDDLNTITEESTLELLAQQLGNFLHGLHALSPAALGLDLPVSNQLSASQRLFLEVEKYLFPCMQPDACNRVTRHFEDYFENSDLHEYCPAIIHGDFGGSNILFEAGSITGVIDFSSSELNDPAMDIAGVSTLGDSFFARICKYYLPDPTMLERAAFYRGTYALQEALHGIRNNNQEAFARGMERYK